MKEAKKKRNASSIAMIAIYVLIVSGLIVGIVPNMSGAQLPENQPPVAIAEPECQETLVGECDNAKFTGESSYDLDGYIVSYDWDFDDGSTGSGPTVIHTYDKAGNYTVLLTVTDDDGATDTDTCIVVVFGGEPQPPEENQPPVAIAEPDYQEIFAGDYAKFTGESSYDPDGYIVSYDWDFGDGTSGRGITVNHTYDKAGNYTVTLTVTDDDGDTGSDTCIVIVMEMEPPPPNENQPPVAIAEPDYQEIFAGDYAKFTGEPSYDLDGYIVSYDWDFDDGSTGSGPTVIHTYDKAGNYTVLLTVTDDDGATDTDTCIVIVIEREPQPPDENQPPVAIAEPDYQEIFAGDYAKFTGESSYDPDGYIVSYDWDFGDGTTGRGITVNHTYDKAGNYTVTLTVTDDDGDTGSDTCFVVVFDGEPQPPEENQLPVAIAEPDYQEIFAGDYAKFTGESSYDPDGYIVSYDWDFGDGTTGRGETVSHTYDKAGNYTVILTVTDDDGATDTDTCIVIVMEMEPPPPNENQPPVAIAEPDYQEIFAGDYAKFDGSESYDPDGYIVSYVWDFGDGTFGRGIMISHLYTEPGNYTVALTVTDDDDATDIDTVIVMVWEMTPRNKPPVADAGKDRFASTFEELTFDGSGSFDLDGTIVSYKWDFGDDCTAMGMTARHAYTDDGTYIVTLEVVDDDKATDTETCIVFVSNQGPIADAGHDQTVYILNEVLFDGSGSYDPDGYIVSYDWDFGDGTYGSGVTTSHVYTITGNYSVRLTVTDDEGATETVTVVVIVLGDSLSKNPVITSPSGGEPLLILTAGLTNMATFEEGFERMVPVEVTAYYGNVHNVHIELVDDGGLEIEIIPIVRNVHECQTVRFYLKIKVPELPDDAASTGITIQLKAVGDEAVSNIEYVDILIRSGDEEGSLSPETTALVSTAGTVGIATILALLIRRRIL